MFKQLGYIAKSAKNNLPKIIFPKAESLDNDDDSSIESLDRINDDDFDGMSLPTTADCLSNVMVQPDSPRSSYIYECLSNRINPRSHLLVRDKWTTSLNLKHQGMVC
jgi:hypothetical protein